MKKTRIIIDCDPGQDDAVMLMMAFARRNVLDILGVCTVAGNVSLEKTTRNALIVCEITGATDIPIYAGARKPLARELFMAHEIHGKEGLNGIDIYEPGLRAQRQSATSFLIETLRAANPNEITMVITGPMTNLATAFIQAPDIKSKIREVVIMGGALRQGGNVTPSAEFNIFVDPHAAEIVYRSGINTVTIGLDVTHRVLASKARLEKIKAVGNKVSDAAYNILGSYSLFDSQKYGQDGGPLHDPCTIACVLKPDLFTTKLVNLEVECNSELTLGHTAIDFWEDMDPDVRPKNTHWAYEVDASGVFRLLIDCLKTYSE